MAQSSEKIDEFVRRLPLQVRKKLNLADIKVLSGTILVKDKIQAHLALVYASDARLRQWKRQEGYCGGRATCMAFTQTGALCARCRAEMRRLKAGETHKSTRSEYGQIRAAERASAKKTRAKK